jgi:hypothetical protein
MKYIRYRKYTGEPGGDVDPRNCSSGWHFFPQSGFESQH